MAYYSVIVFLFIMKLAKIIKHKLDFKKVTWLLSKCYFLKKKKKPQNKIASCKFCWMLNQNLNILSCSIPWGLGKMWLQDIYLNNEDLNVLLPSNIIQRNVTLK